MSTSEEQDLISGSSYSDEPRAILLQRTRLEKPEYITCPGGR